MNVKYDFSIAPLSNERVHFFMSIRSNYIKFPREFTVEPFVSMSPYAKLMYVILSDRLEGSEKNKQFQDDDGTPFVYFAVDDLAVVLGCGTATVTRTLKELEDVGLIYRYRQYACKGTKIYVNDVKKVMLKLVKNVEQCPINLIGRSNQFDWTEQSKPLDCPINLIGQSNQIEQQSISKLTNQKNKSKEKVKCIKSLTPQNEYNGNYDDDFDIDDYELQQELQQERDEQEERKKQQKKAETEELLIHHFEEVFDKIDPNERELLLKVLYDVYTSNRPTYTIKGKDIPRNDVSRKIFMNHWTKVLRAVQSIAEVREKKYIENEFMYLLTILYSC